MIDVKVHVRTGNRLNSLTLDMCVSADAVYPVPSDNHGT